MNGDEIDPMDFRALQMMVVVIANSLRRNQSFRKRFDKDVQDIGTTVQNLPGASAEESDHYSAEFREHYLQQLVCQPVT